MTMRFAITEWLGPLVVVEVDPSIFDGATVDELQKQLEQHFSGVNVAMITPDWEANAGIRVKGLTAPLDVLAAIDLEWRELMLPSNEELPF